MTDRYAELRESLPTIDGGREGLYSATAVRRVAGITFRQLDYWTRHGIVPCSHPAYGSGTHRGYTAADVAEIAAVADVHRAGLALQQAADVVAHHPDPVTFGPVTVTHDRDRSDARVYETLRNIPPMGYGHIISGRPTCGVTGCPHPRVPGRGWCPGHAERADRFGGEVLADVRLDASVREVRAAYGNLLVQQARDLGVNI